MTTKKKVLDLNAIFDEIGSEVDEELESQRVAQLHPQGRILSKLASEILRLERDMTKPGQAVQDSTRIERLAKFIEEANF